MKHDLESAIDKTHQEIDFEDQIAIVNQMITDEVHHICHYSLLNYLLENECCYHHSKLHLSNKHLLGLCVL